MKIRRVELTNLLMKHWTWEPPEVSPLDAVLVEFGADTSERAHRTEIFHTADGRKLKVCLTDNNEVAWVEF
ncbi:MAG TPA: hypothetical protein PLP86_03905 [Armatimonadota bacterium]|nr:hypothetical protein [Armatimonadota bacterium]